MFYSSRISHHWAVLRPEDLDLNLDRLKYLMLYAALTRNNWTLFGRNTDILLLFEHYFHLLL